jgi:hypothetical protein
MLFEIWTHVSRGKLGAAKTIKYQHFPGYQVDALRI